MSPARQRIGWAVAAVIVALGLTYPFFGGKLVQALAPAGDDEGCPGALELPTEEAEAAARRATLCLLNARRAEAGLPALTASEPLAIAARGHSEDMGRRRYFAHDTPDGREPADRIGTAGYPRTGVTVGENLAWGEETAGTPVAIVKGWMESPGHRANILRPEFREIGIGFAYDPPQPVPGRVAVYTTNFGGPRARDRSLGAQCPRPSPSRSSWASSTSRPTRSRTRGRHLDPDTAVEHGRRLVADGAGIVDVGGESTRPGAQPVPVEEELERTIPVVERLAAGRDTGPAGLRISIDTTKADVAAAALAAGARIVNDVSAFRFAPEIAGMVAGAGATCVLMHMRGDPQTMQDDPRYDDVVSEVKSHLEERLAFAVARGSARTTSGSIPGSASARRSTTTSSCCSRLDELVAIGRPLVIGTSRKSLLGRLTGRHAESRLPGTIATNVLALAAGARVFRVHDVAEVSDALTVARAALAGHAPVADA